MWQFQHLALGLDVIGNPAKLLNSFQTGAKDLVIKSREGIVEGYVGSGIALGVKSFLGHVVGEDISINYNHYTTEKYFRFCVCVCTYTYNYA